MRSWRSASSSYGPPSFKPSPCPSSCPRDGDRLGHQGDARLRPGRAAYRLSSQSRSRSATASTSRGSAATSSIPGSSARWSSRWRKGTSAPGGPSAFPNSLFMTEPVLNESLAGEYMLHLMTIPVDRDADLAAIERKGPHVQRRTRAPASSTTSVVPSPPATAATGLHPTDRRPARDLPSRRQEHREHPPPHPHADSTRTPGRATRTEGGSRGPQGKRHSDAPTPEVAVSVSAPAPVLSAVTWRRRRFYGVARLRPIG